MEKVSDEIVLLIDDHTALFRAFYSKKSMQAEETAFWSDSVAVISFIEFSLNQLMENIDS